jgi:hypothetical protein
MAFSPVGRGAGVVILLMLMSLAVFERFKEYDAINVILIC